MSATLDVEGAVNEKYSQAAQARQNALCCPTDYDPQYLSVIPDEIKERDYGCGDPSAFVREGEVVLDLGCGAGKICYIAAQMVGPGGKVIGVDANDEMLWLALKHRRSISEQIGYDNVEFRGPWLKVIDDDGHVLERGKRMAVCDKTFQIYNREPYAPEILAIQPYETIPLEKALAFSCRNSALRDSRETKGLDYDVTDSIGKERCEPGGNCC